MRLAPLLLSFILSLTVSGQHQTDTIFWDGGIPQQVLYFSVVKSSDLSPAEMFQRGIHRGSPVTEIRMLDSTRLHDESGVYLKTKLTGSSKRRSDIPAIARRKQGILPKKEEILESTLATEYLEARAGMLIRKRLLLPYGVAFEDIRPLGETPGMEILQMPDDTSGSFTLKIRIPAGAFTPKLRLNIGKEAVWEKPFALRGYHLNETDFKRRDQLTEEQTWRAEGQDYLYLRLRSTEKLMHLFRDGERYTQLPVGRQLDEVYVASLPAGKYLMEIIDLRSREKRYYWLVTGK